MLKSDSGRESMQCRRYSADQQFGGPSCQATAVARWSTCWDLPARLGGACLAMFGGKFRDKIRVYCDTDNQGMDEPGRAGRRDAAGYTFLKMDLGLNSTDAPGIVSGWIPENNARVQKDRSASWPSTHGRGAVIRPVQYGIRSRIHLTEGLDYWAIHTIAVRRQDTDSVAIDHLGVYPG